MQPEGQEALLQALTEGQPKFGCHKGEPGTGEDLACAGWLAVAGYENFDVRIARLCGRLPQSVMTPAPGWPALYGSYDEMAEANGVTTCEHPADQRRHKFRGEILCESCSRVIGYWKPTQPTMAMRFIDDEPEAPCSPS